VTSHLKTSAAASKKTVSHGEPRREEGGEMLERKLTVPEIILIAGTRMALGAGIGLLLSTRLSNDQRKAAGLALRVVGGLPPIPLAIGVIGKKDRTNADIRAVA